MACPGTAGGLRGCEWERRGFRRGGEEAQLLGVLEPLQYILKEKSERTFGGLDMGRRETNQGVFPDFLAQANG